MAYFAICVHNFFPHVVSATPDRETLHPCHVLPVMGLTGKALVRCQVSTVNLQNTLKQAC